MFLVILQPIFGIFFIDSKIGDVDLNLVFLLNGLAID